LDAYSTGPRIASNPYAETHIFRPRPQIGDADMDEALILGLSICGVALFYLLVFVVSRYDKK
jgi:hypothetical protein